VRSFVNPNVRNDTATAVVQPLLEAGCVSCLSRGSAVYSLLDLWAEF
jgi:hypothetical protein